MILNGPEGSLKGHVFDRNNPDSLPRYLRQGMHPDVDAEVKRLNERYRIVENCPECGAALIAEEVQAHAENHIPARLRALVRTVMSASKEDRKEVLDWVQKLDRGSK